MTTRRWRGLVRGAAWDHPEWWTLAISGGAWLMMIGHFFDPHRSCHTAAPSAQLANWMLMVAAMMFPFLRYNVRSIAFRSLARRRHAAILTFLVGYGAVWLLAGVPAVMLAAIPSIRTDAATAMVLVAAAIWCRSVFHARAIAMCHEEVSLAPFGWRASRDLVRHGARVGGACVATCWPLMLACTLTGHGAVAMLGGLAIGALERLPFRPRPGLVSAACLGLALWYAGWALPIAG